MKSPLPVFLLALVSCTLSGMDSSHIEDLYVDDFHSDDTRSCKTSDVELNHSQAREFFDKAREVDYKIIHDHYEVAPCYIAGPLKYRDTPCSWKIMPGGTGSMSCGNKTWYFVCDDCDYLFNRVVPLDNFMIYKDIIRLDRPD